ncbi:ATP-binding protein [Leisingera caerulea]|uniref:ATP-binding protein n=1 Tax=Leisingera caerulea TaxID=506591 RepID=UPI00040A39AB|nr:ATP-binding protein [Leisingera caerulea]
MHFIMLIGCSGSGKSTIAEDIRARNPSAVIISSDQIIEDFAQAEGISYQEAYPAQADNARDICEQTAVRAFERGLDVIWDQTNLQRSVREKRLAMVPDGYTKIAVCLHGGLAAHRSRILARASAGGRDIPREVSKRQISDMEMPDFDEGFDRIMAQEVTMPEPAAELSCAVA